MKINSKNLKVECSFQHDGRVCNDTEFEFFKPKMLTDFKIYSCILFHLISNAVNHCHKDSKIAIVVELIPFDEPGFSGKLSTKITNEGSVKDLKYQRGDVNFKTFQLEEFDLQNDQDLKTVGLGLSTADALTYHMGGDLFIKSIKGLQGNITGTEVEFSLLTCD